MEKVTIIGSGSWGVALSILLCNNGYSPCLWSFSESETDYINNKHECIFLPGIKLNQNIVATTNIEEALKNSKVVLMVTPSKFVRDTLKKMKPYVNDEQYILMCSKGLEDDTLLTLAEVVEQELPNNKIGVLSGPSHAEEVARNLPTTIVLCSKYDEITNGLHDMFMSDVFRVYTAKDVMGVEIGSALKNIIAMASGMAAGLGYGDNVFAALITRGLVEIARLGNAMGCETNTFYGLTGLGDLIVTCLSQHSRNRKAGYLIGQGLTLDEAVKEVGMVVESVNTTKVAKKIVDKYNVETPIINEVYKVLFENKSARQSVQELMTREKKCE